MGHPVNSKEPCPICNHNDWCYWCDGKQGPLIACKRSKRDQSANAEVQGFDGNIYVFLRETDESVIFEEKSQREEGRRQWVEEQKRINPNFGKGRWGDALPAKKPSISISPAKTSYVNRSDYKKNYIEPASDEQLDIVYRALLDLLVLEPQHRNYLIGEKWTDDIIKMYNIKSLPPIDSVRYKERISSPNLWRKDICRKLIQRFGQNALVGVPGFYRDSKEEWTISGKGGILFPVYNGEGQMMLRIRPDWTEEDKRLAAQRGDSLPKYKNLSSYKEVYDDANKVVSNKYDMGSHIGNRVGVYCKPTDNYSACIITEGEKKGIVTNYFKNIPTVIVPGVSSWRKIFDKTSNGGKSVAEFLHSKGTRIFVVCFDADKAFNKNVLQSEQRTVEELKKMGYQVMVGSWNPKFAKGLDDLIVDGGAPIISSAK